MPKVTSVEPQHKRPRRFNIFLDGQFAFGADEETVVNFRLVPGKFISSEDLVKILFETTAGKLMEKMYRWFGIRQRSEKEVRAYFRVKNAELRVKKKEEISNLMSNLVIERLKQKGMINDLAFAKSWVEARRRSKKRGKVALRAELLQKGVDKEIIEEAINDEHQAVSEEQLAKQALEKGIKSWKNLPGLEKKKKALEFLLRRGFEYPVAKQAVRKFLFDFSADK